MKLTKYIKQLQDLHLQYGDVVVKIKSTYEHEDLSLEDKCSDADRPHYDEDHNCIVVHEDFVRFDD